MYFKANMGRPFLPLTFSLTLKHTYHKRTVIRTYMHGVPIIFYSTNTGIIPMFSIAKNNCSIKLINARQEKY